MVCLNHQVPVLHLLDFRRVSAWNWHCQGAGGRRWEAADETSSILHIFQTKMLRLSHAECNTWQPVMYWWSPHWDQDLGLLLSLSCVLRSKEMLFWLFLSLLFSCSIMSNFFNAMDYSPPGSSVHGISRQECWSGNRNAGEALNDNNDHHAIINYPPRLTIILYYHLMPNISVFMIGLFPIKT